MFMIMELWYELLIFEDSKNFFVLKTNEKKNIKSWTNLHKFKFGKIQLQRLIIKSGMNI